MKKNTFWITIQQILTLFFFCFALSLLLIFLHGDFQNMTTGGGKKVQWWKSSSNIEEPTLSKYYILVQTVPTNQSICSTTHNLYYNEVLFSHRVQLFLERFFSARCCMFSFPFTFFNNLLPELQHPFTLCGRGFLPLTLSAILFASWQTRRTCCFGFVSD